MRFRETAARLVPSSQSTLMTATKLEAGAIRISGLLKAGFRRAVQVELLVITRLQMDSVFRVSGPLRSLGILFRNLI
jgi:hypothetical protein